MSIWHHEIVKVNGEYKAYVEIQNEFTGNITGRLQTIFHKNGIDYVRADGRMLNVTNDLLNQKRYEETVKEALQYYKERMLYHDKY